MRATKTCLWFCNDPVRCIADNRRILEPHTEQHAALQQRGGETRRSVNGDGAHRIRPGSYGQPTPGRIARNIFAVSNNCASQRAYKRRARELGLAAHGAPMPLALARKLVRFLSDVGQLVADPFVIWGCITQLFSPKDAPLPTMTSIFLLDKLISIGKYNTY